VIPNELVAFMVILTVSSDSEIFQFSLEETFQVEKEFTFETSIANPQFYTFKHKNNLIPSCMYFDISYQQLDES